MKNDKCPKCGGRSKERHEELRLTHKEYPAVQLQKWVECSTCEWTWTTLEQREYNKKEYGRRWRVNV